MRSDETAVGVGDRGVDRDGYADGHRIVRRTDLLGPACCGVVEPGTNAGERRGGVTLSASSRRRPRSATPPADVDDEAGRREHRVHRRGRIHARLVKLLLDTNVLVAALITRGTCSDLLEHCVRQHVVISSEPLLNELRDVLERKFRQRAIDVRAAIQLFAQTFTLVGPDSLDPPVCRDRDDDIVLATALAGQCAAIITGDQDFLVLDPFRAIRVPAPSAFWRWESGRDEGRNDG